MCIIISKIEENIFYQVLWELLIVHEITSQMYLKNNSFELITSSKINVNAYLLSN